MKLDDIYDIAERITYQDCDCEHCVLESAACIMAGNICVRGLIKSAIEKLEMAQDDIAQNCDTCALSNHCSYESVQYSSCPINAWQWWGDNEE